MRKREENDEKGHVAFATVTGSGSCTMEASFFILQNRYIRRALQCYCRA